MAIYYTTNTSAISNDNITTSKLCYNNITTTTTGTVTIPYQDTTTTTATATIPYPNTTITGTALQQNTISLKDTMNLILEKMLRPNDIDKIEELKPEKVYRFTFNDKTIIKTVCSEMDIFDLRYACFLAIAKKLYSKTLTFEGVLNEIPFLMYYKDYNKMVDKAIKKFYKEQEEKAKEEEAKRISKRKHDKLIARKIAKKERERQKQVDIIKEAIIAAKEEE